MRRPVLRRCQGRDGHRSEHARRAAIACPSARGRAQAARAQAGVASAVAAHRSAPRNATQRAKLAAGETTLILGATGVTGQLAVQIAKLLGAKRVVAAGRNEGRLSRLLELGADVTIQLNQSPESLKAAFAREAGEEGFDVILDYLWGAPTEILLAAITRSEFSRVTKEIRLVQVGESAGASISLSAAVLRSTPLTESTRNDNPMIKLKTDFSNYTDK